MSRARALAWDAVQSSKAKAGTIACARNAASAPNGAASAIARSPEAKADSIRPFSVLPIGTVEARSVSLLVLYRETKFLNLAARAFVSLVSTFLQTASPISGRMFSVRNASESM